MLNRRFAIPALCSLGLHSALFFGIPKSAVLMPVVATPLPQLLKPMPKEEIVMPPEPSEPSAEGGALIKLGEGLPPTEIDIPRDGPADAFRIDVDPRTPVGTFVGDHIPVVGDPNGSPFGTEIGPLAPKIFSVGSLDRVPEARAQTRPLYPDSARREGLEGKVEIEYVVGPSGEVVNVRVLSSSDRRFEEPTLRAVSKWRFEAGKKEGRAVSFRMRQVISFGLSE